MQVAGDSASLTEALQQQLAEASDLISARDFGRARQILAAVLDEDRKVTIEDGEWGLSFESVEQFLYATVLLKNGRIARPEGSERMVWNPVPVARCRLTLGGIAIELDEAETARSELTAAIAANPVDPVSYFELAYLEQWKLAQPTDALRHARSGYTLARRPQERSRGLRTAGACCIDLGQMDLARSFYLEAVELDPLSELAESQLKYILMDSRTGRDIPVPDSGGRKSALDLIGFPPSIDVAHAEARVLYVDILMQQGQSGTAIEAIKDAVSWVPDPTPFREFLDRIQDGADETEDRRCLGEEEGEVEPGESDE